MKKEMRLDLGQEINQNLSFSLLRGPQSKDKTTIGLRPMPMEMKLSALKESFDMVNLTVMLIISFSDLFSLKIQLFKIVQF